MGKTSLRMGMHHRVTEERYRSMKSDLCGGMDVEAVARLHGFSASTVRAVRRAENYNEYRICNDKTLRKPLNKTCLESSVPGVHYEDYRTKNFCHKPLKAKSGSEREDDHDLQMGLIATAIFVLILGILFVTFLFCMMPQGVK